MRRTPFQKDPINKGESSLEIQSRIPHSASKHSIFPNLCCLHGQQDSERGAARRRLDGSAPVSDKASHHLHKLRVIRPSRVMPTTTPNIEDRHFILLRQLKPDKDPCVACKNECRCFISHANVVVFLPFRCKELISPQK